MHVYPLDFTLGKPVFLLWAFSEPSSPFLWGNEVFFSFWTLSVFSSCPTLSGLPWHALLPPWERCVSGLCLVCESCVDPFWESECFHHRSTHWSTRAPVSAASPEIGAIPSPFGQHNRSLPWPCLDTGPWFLSWNQPWCSYNRDSHCGFSSSSHGPQILDTLWCQELDTKMTASFLPLNTVGRRGASFTKLGQSDIIGLSLSQLGVSAWGELKRN